MFNSFQRSDKTKHKREKKKWGQLSLTLVKRIYTQLSCARFIGGSFFFSYSDVVGKDDDFDLMDFGSDSCISYFSTLLTNAHNLSTDTHKFSVSMDKVPLLLSFVLYNI